jgi:hypothetical protein
VLGRCGPEGQDDGGRRGGRWRDVEQAEGVRRGEEEAEGGCWREGGAWTQQRSRLTIRSRIWTEKLRIHKHRASGTKLLWAVRAGVWGEQDGRQRPHKNFIVF